MHNLFWAVIILFAIAALMRMDWVYYLVYVVGGVWIFSHWSIRRAFGRLDVRRDMHYRAFAGERIPVSLRIANYSWLPLPWLKIEERIPLDLRDADDYRVVVSVGSKGVHEHKYRLLCKRRGYFPVGPMVLNTGDLFGFTDAGRQENAPVYVTVYPQVLPLHEIGISSRSPFGMISSRQRLFEDPNRMAGVREYVAGDNQRMIHWKASAREDKLLIKKFQPAIALNVAVILDLNRAAYPISGAIGASEWAIVIAASIAGYVMSRRQPVGLLTNGLDSVTGENTKPVPTRQGQGHLMNILTALARVQMQECEEELEQWLPRRLADLDWGATVILITPHLSEATLWALHNAYRRGSNVTVLVCAPQANYEAIRAQGKHLHIQVQRTIWEKDLQSLHV